MGSGDKLTSSSEREGFLVPLSSVCVTIENSLIHSSPLLAVSAALSEQEARSLLRAGFLPP